MVCFSAETKIEDMDSCNGWPMVTEQSSMRCNAGSSQDQQVRMRGRAVQGQDLRGGAGKGKHNKFAGPTGRGGPAGQAGLQVEGPAGRPAGQRAAPERPRPGHPLCPSHPLSPCPVSGGNFEHGFTCNRDSFGTSFRQKTLPHTCEHSCDASNLDLCQRGGSESTPLTEKNFAPKNLRTIAKRSPPGAQKESHLWAGGKLWRKKFRQSGQNRWRKKFLKVWGWGKGIPPAKMSQK